MPDPSKLLLLDIFHLAFLMLGLGLLAYALIRRSNPLIRWHEHGSVWTDPFQKIDVLIMMVIVGCYYALIHFSTYQESTSLTEIDSVEVAAMIIFQFVSMTILLAGIFFTLFYVRGVDLAELLGLRRLRSSQIIVWALAMMAITFPIVIGVALGWNFLLERAFGEKPQSQELVTIMSESGDMTVKLLIAFSACIFAPVTEEILFRGYFYPALKRFSERYFAAIVISLLFALIHSNTMSVLPLFVLAMSFTIAYELTGCLLVPIVMHAMFNTIQVVLMFLYPSNG